MTTNFTHYRHSLQSGCINEYVHTFQYILSKTARNKHDWGKCQVILSTSRKTSRENEPCDKGVASTHSIHQKSSTNADSSSASHEIPRLFFKKKSRNFATGCRAGRIQSRSSHSTSILRLSFHLHPVLHSGLFPDHHHHHHHQ